MNDHFHTVTDQAKTVEIPGFCDDVTVVTNDFEKSEKPNGDIHGQPNTRMGTGL